jgi:Ribbon-helix-helix domain
MKRTTIWLTEVQIGKLAKLSKKTGIKTSEMVRRFVDDGLKKHGA